MGGESSEAVSSEHYQRNFRDINMAMRRLFRHLAGETGWIIRRSVVYIGTSTLATRARRRTH